MKSYRILLLVALFAGASSPAKDLFVSVDGTNPTAPYANWETAATVIQDAVDFAGDGDTVYVADGIYDQGGIPAQGFAHTNRVCATNAVTIQSMNGPEHTFIVGKKHSHTLWRGPDAIRGAFLDGGAILTGFTITNGHSRVTGDLKDQDGGGIMGIYPASSYVTNCIITDNTAHSTGGGANSVVLNDCLIKDNSSTGSGGGLSGCTANDCLIMDNTANNAGGASSCDLTSCNITGNQAWYSGGGTQYGSLTSCLITGNYSAREGGGVYSSFIINCTVTKNTSGFKSCGGIINCYYVKNCIVVDNAAALSPTNFTGCTFVQDNCFSRSAGSSSRIYRNIVADPLFVDQDAGDFSLQTNSPCINAGYNAHTPNGKDLRGAPRHLDGTIDMGCYEYFVLDEDSDSDLIPNLWEVEHGLNMTNGLDATVDSDNDSFSNQDEYIADTHPLDSGCYLHVTAVSNAPQLTCYFDSSTNRIYSFQMRTNLTDGAWTNIPGQPARAGTGAGDSFVPLSDMQAEFYKINVELP